LRQKCVSLALNVQERSLLIMVVLSFVSPR
jgi:hypothetical protein